MNEGARQPAAAARHVKDAVAGAEAGSHPGGDEGGAAGLGLAGLMRIAGIRGSGTTSSLGGEPVASTWRWC